MTAVDVMRVALWAADLLEPWLRRHVLRGLVLVSAMVAAFAVLAVVAAHFVSAEPWAAALLVGGATTTVFGACLSWQPSFLQVPPEVSLLRATLAVAGRTVAGYVALVPVAALAAGSAVWMHRGRVDPHAQVLVGMFALWAPLFWAPAVGPVWAWQRDLRRHAR